jgi:hypothetical protein
MGNFNMLPDLFRRNEFSIIIHGKVNFMKTMFLNGAQTEKFKMNIMYRIRLKNTKFG